MSDNIIPFDIPLNKVTIGDSIVNEIYCNNKLVYSIYLQERVLEYTYDLINLILLKDEYFYQPVILPSREKAIKDLNNQLIVTKYSYTYDAHIYLRAKDTGGLYEDLFQASIMSTITAYNLDTLTLRLGNVVRLKQYTVPEIGATLDIRNVNHLIIDPNHVYEDKYWNYFINLDIIALEVNEIEIRFRRFHEPTAPTYLSLLKYSDYRKDLFKDTWLCHWNNDYIDILFPENNNITSVEGMFSNASNQSWVCCNGGVDCGFNRDLGYRHHENKYPSDLSDYRKYIFDIVIDTQYTNNITNYNNFFYNYNTDILACGAGDWHNDTLSLLNWRIAEGATFNGFLEGANLSTITISGWNAEDGVNFEGFLKNVDKPNAIYVRNCNFGSPSSVAQMFYNKNNSIHIENCTFYIKSNLKDMSYMFFNCNTEPYLDLSHWDVSGVETMKGMFSGCEKLKTLDVSNWNTPNVTDLSGMFSSCSSLTELDVSNWNTPNVTDVTSMFNGCSSLTELDVSNWNTENVRDMSSMFNGCSSLTELDVSNWNTPNVTDVDSMFRDCSSLTELNLSNWNTDSLSSVRYAFRYCTLLTTVGDISDWNTEKVINMEFMFANCKSLRTLDLSGWDTSNVTNLDYVFAGCSSLTELDLTSWDTSKVRNKALLFSGVPRYCNIKVGSKWTLTEWETRFEGTFNRVE